MSYAIGGGAFVALTFFLRHHFPHVKIVFPQMTEN